MAQYAAITHLSDMRTITITISEDLYVQLVQTMAKLGEVDRNRFIATLLREALMMLEGYRLALVVVVRRCRSKAVHDGAVKAVTRIYLDGGLCAEVLLTDNKAERLAKAIRGARLVKVVPIF